MSALLASVTVLAPAFAVPPSPAETTAAPGGSVRFEGDALHIQIDADTEEPSVVAFALLVRTLRGQPLTSPAAWERVHARRALAADDAPFAATEEGPLSVVLPAATVAQLRKHWGATARWHDRILLAATPDGPVVLAPPGDDLPLQPGDVIVSIDGRSTTGLYDVDRFSAFDPMTVIRGDERMRLEPLLTPLPPDRISVAPTCGSCCHGQCGDDVPPVPIPVQP